MGISITLKDKKKENTSIYAIIRYKGERYKISLREKVNTQYWNDDKKRLREVRKYPEAIEINSRLDKWENTINKVLSDFSYIMKIPTKEEFSNALDCELNLSNTNDKTFTDFINEFIPSSGRAELTLKSYKTTFNILLDFEKKHCNKLTFNDINLKFYKNFKIYIENLGYSKNYFGKQIKNIKLFMNEAKDLGLHDSSEHMSKKFKKTSETSDTVYLNEEELFKIYKLVFNDDLIKEYYPNIKEQNLSKKIAMLEIVRNKFLIGAYTALRVSDFSRLREINLDANFIRIKPIKGASIQKNEDIVIPIHWIIKDIIEKGFDLSATIPDQKINQYIKDISMMVGINLPITTSMTKGGKLIEETTPKYKLITTHTARRSGATNMFKAGISSIRIMKITGHKSEKTFMKYIRITQEENAISLANHPFFRKN